MVSAAMHERVVTVNEVIDGRVSLDLDCLDRLYLHGYHWRPVCQLPTRIALSYLML